MALLDNPYDVAVDGNGNVYIADTENNRVRKVADSGIATYFPQFVAGGGWSSLFTIVNIAQTQGSGNLIFRDSQGNPLSVDIELTDSSGTIHPVQTSSSYSFSIPAGGSIILSAASSMQSISAGNAIRTGWAQLISAGSLSGFVTYEYANGTATECIVSVPQSQLTANAVIPVHMDAGTSRQPAYALANPGSQPISVHMILKGQDGTVVEEPIVIDLGPGEQIARYLLQDVARDDFKGTLVLSAPEGGSFAAFAFLDKEGLLAAIPLIRTP